MDSSHLIFLQNKMFFLFSESEDITFHLAADESFNLSISFA